MQAFEQEEWLLKFAGQLEERFEQAPQPETDQEQSPIEITELKLGDPFPAKLVPPRRPAHLPQAKSGGQNGPGQKEGRGGWRFARLGGDQAADPNQGQDGQNLLQAAVEYKKKLSPVKQAAFNKRRTRGCPQRG